MKVGSKGRYAVAALVDVARHSGLRSVSLADVAQRQGISLSYLEQLFAMLRRNGLVVSARGPGGGYKLARSAAETTIRAVFEAVDEGETDGGADQPGGGAVSPLWRELNRQTQIFLDGVTLADVVDGRYADLPGVTARDGTELSRPQNSA